MHFRFFVVTVALFLSSFGALSADEGFMGSLKVPFVSGVCVYVDFQSKPGSHPEGKKVDFNGADEDCNKLPGDEDAGMRILSSHAGRVVLSGFIPSYGWVVYLQSTEFPECLSRYAHLRERPLVQKGDVVLVGERLGRLGATGLGVTGSHLHVEFHCGVGDSPTRNQFGTLRKPDVLSGQELVQGGSIISDNVEYVEQKYVMWVEEVK